MENETLKQILKQIRKYELSKYFSDVQDLNIWLSTLNHLQITNFLSLDIDLEDIRNFRKLIIDSNLLNCKDYKKRVTAMSALRNGDGCWHLFDAICNPNFLKSKNFYKDIEMLSKADTARYGLWILGEDAFINSPYHDEDLKLLVETHDVKKDEPLDFVVSEALATVAGNINSINSPYHRTDMELIASSGSEVLQSTYPKHSLNYLAIDEVSLKDKYHTENMQILATNPISSELLYMIMTNPKIVAGKNYREEVEALRNAKSKTTARALYYYIANPKRKFLSDLEFSYDCTWDAENVYISDRNSVAGSNDPDYLNNLIMINKIDDKFVMHVVALLMNPNFINSPYKNFDLELLQKVSSKSIFMNLYSLMSNEMSLYNKYHKNDAILISNSTVDGVCDLLLEKACNEYSLNSINHEYDMEFISKLQLDSISEEIYFEIYYYLFKQNGIDDPQHKEKLEKLLRGEIVERSDSVSDYLDNLQNQIDSTSFPVIESISKTRTRILSIFKKK